METYIQSPSVDVVETVNTLINIIHLGQTNSDFINEWKELSCEVEFDRPCIIIFV